MPRTTTTTRAKAKPLSPRETIIAEIERRELTQRPLAAKMGLSTSTMRRALEQDELLTVRRVLEFAQAMGVHPADILPVLAESGQARGSVPDAVLDLPIETLITVASCVNAAAVEFVPELG